MEYHLEREESLADWYNEDVLPDLKFLLETNKTVKNNLVDNPIFNQFTSP